MTPAGDRVVAGMTSRYLVALGLVALLSLAAYLSLRQTIATQETMAAIVNFSGTRRYTSQRAALFCLRLVAAGDEATRAEARSAMRASLERLERSHDGLIHGDPQLNLPGNPSPAIRRLYFDGPDALDPLVREYLRRARALADAPSAELRDDHPDLAWILTNAPNRLLDLLDRMVFEYQRESEAEIRRLQRAETAVLATTLVVLTLEALFIFRPMVIRVREERRNLLAAEAYVRSILDHGHDGIATVDDGGRIEEANPAIARIFARHPSAIAGAAFTELVPDAPRPLPSSGVRTLTGVRDGARFAVDVAFSRMPVDGGGRTIAILRESTEQLQRYARSLEQRNQELDQFAYVASHDLKAPLRAIANLSTWLQEELAGDGDARQVPELLRLMHARVRRMEALIEGIHQYAIAGRPATGAEPVDVGQLLREIVDEHRPDPRFTVVLPDDAPVLRTDRTRLWQVFTNLIGNAIKHHQPGPGRIAVTWVPRGEQIEFTVADDGPGIPPEFHEKVFVIFQTLEPKDARESLGLGLALVRKIVKEQGGDLTLTSQPGAGSAFRFTWPA